MSLSKRNIKIALDNACGKSMAELAAEYELNTSRIGQICLSVRRALRVGKKANARQIGLALVRIRESNHYESLFRADCPRTFHLENGLRNYSA